MRIIHLFLTKYIHIGGKKAECMRVLLKNGIDTTIKFYSVVNALIAVSKLNFNPV